MKGDPELIDEFTERLTIDEKASFMEGVSRSIEDMIDKNINASSVVNQMLKKPKFRKAIRAVFGNGRQQLEFVSFLRNESKFNTTKNTVFGGSDTAPKLGDVDKFFKDSDLADAAINVATGRPSSAVLNIMRKISSLKGKIPESQIEELRILLTNDQPAVIKKLQQLSGTLKKGRAKSPTPPTSAAFIPATTQGLKGITEQNSRNEER